MEQPEPNFLGFDGIVCNEETTDVLQRRPVRSISITRIGKETNKLRRQLADAGLGSEALPEYGANETM